MKATSFGNIVVLGGRRRYATRVNPHAPVQLSGKNVSDKIPSTRDMNMGDILFWVVKFPSGTSVKKDQVAAYIAQQRILRLIPVDHEWLERQRSDIFSGDDGMTTLNENVVLLDLCQSI